MVFMGDGAIDGAGSRQTEMSILGDKSWCATSKFISKHLQQTMLQLTNVSYSLHGDHFSPLPSPRSEAVYRPDEPQTRPAAAVRAEVWGWSHLRFLLH